MPNNSPSPCLQTSNTRCKQIKICVRKIKFKFGLPYMLRSMDPAWRGLRGRRPWFPLQCIESLLSVHIITGEKEVDYTVIRCSWQLRLKQWLMCPTRRWRLVPEPAKTGTDYMYRINTEQCDLLLLPALSVKRLFLLFDYITTVSQRLKPHKWTL